MAQTKQINLLRNMLADPVPALPDHDREALIVRGLWLVMAGGWAWGGAHLWPGVIASAFLAGCAVAVVVSASLKLEPSPRSPLDYRVGEIR